MLFLICKDFISSFNLVMVALCCVNLDAGEVFGILILAKWGIILLRSHLWFIYIYIGIAIICYSFSFQSLIHAIGTCRMRWFLVILRSFLHSSLLCTFSCHPSPPTMLPSLTWSWHLFLGLPLNLVVPKFIYNTLLGILFSSILCTYPNQCNQFNLIDSVIVGFFSPCINLFVGYSY